MTIPTNGPYWIYLAGRGTAQTATLEYGSKPNVQNRFLSTDVLGPYSDLSSAEAELKNLTITGNVTVVNGSTQAVLGSVNVSSGATSTSQAPGGSSQPSNPTKAIQAEGGTVGSLPSVPNPLSGLAAIGAFFGNLSKTSTWVRVAKVALGGTLLIVGLAHITGAGNTVANTARKIPLPV